LKDEMEMGDKMEPTTKEKLALEMGRNKWEQPEATPLHHPHLHI